MRSSRNGASDASLRASSIRRLDVTVLQWTEIPIPELYNLINSQGDTHPFYTTDSIDWLAERYELEYLEDCDCFKIKREGMK